MHSVWPNGWVFISELSGSGFESSCSHNKGVSWMDFGGNKTPVEVIKESAFGGKYFRSIYSGVTKEPHG